jgi:predicted RNase H-like nuclease (RuvC/YqgF family)
MKTIPVNGETKLNDLQQTLDIIEHKLNTEVLAKQQTIERQEQEIKRLHAIIDARDKIVAEYSQKLADCTRGNEGNRQLINKLLNDIERLNQDVEWYKRTYEKRSLLGTLREKLLRKKAYRDMAGNEQGDLSRL